MKPFPKKVLTNQNKFSSNLTKRSKYGTLSGIIGITVNLLLAGIKLFVGIVASSVAIIADALNNLSDAGASIITILSFKISSKPADKGHPFGHARMEYIASMVISFLILLVGTQLLIDSGEMLIGISELKNTVITSLTVIILSVSVIAKLSLGIFYRFFAKKTDSKVVKAAAADSLTDAISTLAVLISGIIIKYTNFQQLDAIVGLAVSIMIIIAGGKILLETKNALLGEAPIDETVKNIKTVVAEYPEVIGMHDLLVHNYGPNISIASFHAEVDGEGDIYQLHDVIDNLEREIKSRLGITCTIHMDPIATNDERKKEYEKFLEDILKKAELDFPIHDFRVMIGSSHTKLIFDILIPFEYKMSEQRIKDKICSYVSEVHQDYFCIITIDRG